MRIPNLWKFWILENSESSKIQNPWKFRISGNSEFLKSQNIGKIQNAWKFRISENSESLKILKSMKIQNLWNFQILKIWELVKFQKLWKNQKWWKFEIFEILRISRISKMQNSENKKNRFFLYFRFFQIPLIFSFFKVFPASFSPIFLNFPLSAHQRGQVLRSGCRHRATVRDHGAGRRRSSRLGSFQTSLHNAQKVRIDLSGSSGTCLYSWEESYASWCGSQKLFVWRGAGLYFIWI